MTDFSAWTVAIARWACWPDTGGGPELGFVEPMLRRRLSPLARAVLHVANACAQDCPSASFVFASRHGELQRTVELLRDLAMNEELSPTLFSLSVLNASAGIFSIARSDHAPVTAIAAGCESFGYGLLEAHLRAQVDVKRPVIYVYADTPAPEPLGQQPGDPQSVFALGLMIGAEGHLRLHTEIESTTDAGLPGSPQVDACLQALEGGEGFWASGYRRWHWKLQ